MDHISRNSHPIFFSSLLVMKETAGAAVFTKAKENSLYSRIYHKNMNREVLSFENFNEITEKMLSTSKTASWIPTEIVKTQKQYDSCQVTL